MKNLQEKEKEVIDFNFIPETDHNYFMCEVCERINGKVLNYEGLCRSCSMKKTRLQRKNEHN